MKQGSLHPLGSQISCGILAILIGLAVTLTAQEPKTAVPSAALSAAAETLLPIAGNASDHHDPRVPAVLQPWQNWVQWDVKDAAAPAVFNNAGERIALWPARLAIKANADKGSFLVTARVFTAAWLPLPGNAETWPQEVRVDGKPAVVIERGGRPATRLEPGVREVSGTLPWRTMPQRLAIPPEVGLLELTVNGNRVGLPERDTHGVLWLKRGRVEKAAEPEFLETKVYRVLEDGIPMWLRTELELSVSGKSREEDLGHALPSGWRVAAVESKLPCAVDDSGRVRVQVRGGKWTLRIEAFRAAPAASVGFAANSRPIAANELVGFRTKPDFRVIELADILQIDVSQTTFPEKWRGMPVYQWDTSAPFRIEEKMRGMGFQKPAGLTVKREFWLDDDGALMTFRDRVTGTAQQAWRLDASPGQSLGAARMRGENQLITENPVSGGSGIEIRQRQIELEAVGRIDDPRNFPASGWQADVELCEATLHLPPGWRVLALFGAEWVKGDWLRNWDLLDLFLLLIFTMAVGKLWGPIPALVAALGFGLSYHEPNAPKFLWLLLLVPVAILRLGDRLTGVPRTLAGLFRALAIAALLVVLVPFVGEQVQGVLYPQLEPGGRSVSARPGTDAYLRDWLPMESLSASEASVKLGRQAKKKQQLLKEDANLQQDVQARIQTGPAVPTWQWRSVRFGWRGPVTESEMVHALLIPPAIQRAIAVVRVAAVILLLGILLGAGRSLKDLLRKKPKPPKNSGGTSPVGGAATAGLLLFLLAGAAPQARADSELFPPKEMLEALRARLLEAPDAFPRAAEIPSVRLTVDGNTLAMEAQIHVAATCAVPLPGKLPAWSPVSVLVDGEPAEAVARRGDSLWVVLDPGTRSVQVEGLLPQATEWVWSSQLAARHLAVDAPGWTVTGIRPNGVPEKQVTFTLKKPITEAEAAYDRKDFAPAVAVERSIELGLIWQVRTTLTRLSPGAKAVVLPIPLLPGEQVLASPFEVKNGIVEARLGVGQKQVSWQSTLPQTDSLALQAHASGSWVERWRLVVSPVWNVAFDGLDPVYQLGAGGLEPVWAPWPGERVELALSRPQALPGATMTIRAVEHSTTLGSRQRISGLKLSLQASLGQDLVIDVDPEADITALKISDNRNPEGTVQPVRRDGASVIIPVRPGEQVIDLEWKKHRTLTSREVVDRLKLPVESSNIDTSLMVPKNRWVLWTVGPLRGPAVRWWSMVVLSLVGALVLSRLPASPLRGVEWALLLLGLTQVHPAAGLAVIGWFFLVAWRGGDRACGLPPLRFDALQLAIVALAVPVAIVFLAALHRGLLGQPQIMVQGHHSTPTSLRWFSQRADSVLPEAGVFTVSIWCYRLLMLAWALWLAAAMVRWVRWGWTQFSRRALWKKSPPKIVSGATRNP